MMLIRGQSQTVQVLNLRKTMDSINRTKYTMKKMESANDG